MCHPPCMAYKSRLPSDALVHLQPLPVTVKKAIFRAEGGVLLADLTGTRVAVVCDSSCGCPYPCPGGAPCRCTALAAGGGAGHKECLSGNNCGCRPCGCGPPAAAAAAESGRFYCRCGPSCTCTPCGA
ncbi:hypothetical protein EUGRSUZ_G00244 [Eucalyptus grandis]|uniref:Uncharacterized protein n=2 Tax=Eucalyptus grandis TaxID=71139 RepID=A0ACC3JZR4_EUCGR|nr:hypothetical protein EUGRSUZ_G00244 [Eucalyptus grandis]